MDLPSTIISQTYRVMPKERVHRNSIQRSILMATMQPPKVPVNNPKQELLDRMASY